MVFTTLKAALQDATSSPHGKTMLLLTLTAGSNGTEESVQFQKERWWMFATVMVMSI